MTRFSSAFPAPGDRVRALLQQATTLQNAGRFGEAIPVLESVVQLEPKNAGVLRALATCLVTVERLPAARARLEEVLKLEPRDPRSYSILAYSWKREAAWEPALAAIDRAISYGPNQPAFVATKAEILHLAGRTDEAMAVLEPVLGHASSVPSIAGTFAAMSKKLKRQAEAVPMLRAVLARPDLPTNGRIKYLFDLASLLDSMGDAEGAWPLFVEGNRIKNERWDPAAHTATVNTIVGSWTREAIAALPKSPVDGSPFVFIVGMPRSGTSLVEQILSTSPNLHAAGERNELMRIAHRISGHAGMGLPTVPSPAPLASEQVLRGAATDYATPIRALAPNAERITDKMPPNFTHLGLIQALLPGARVIHCRRKAMDSCLSCYFQLFGGSLSFAYNLDHCGRYYADYERLMAHWHATLDLPILDVPYESVVADQEGWTRRLFEFIGLPFTERALRFHESERTTLTASSQQVREPIHARSVARWKAYSAHLEPLRKALGPYAEGE